MYIAAFALVPVWDLIRANAQGPFSLSGFVDEKLWYTGMPSMWLPSQPPHSD